MRARGVFRTSRYEDRPSAATRYLYQLCHLLLVELVFRLQSYANVSRTSVLSVSFCAPGFAHGFAARVSVDDVDENKNQLSDQRNLKSEIQIGSR